MAQRSDLVLEGPITLDGSGNYTGPWIDSAEIRSVGVIHSGTPGSQIEFSSDASAVINIDTWTNFTEKPVHSRFSVAGGTANATVKVSVRAMS